MKKRPTYDQLDALAGLLARSGERDLARRLRAHGRAVEAGAQHAQLAQIWLR